MKNILIPIFAVLLVSLYFGSCSSSSDDDPAPEVWQPDLAKFDQELNYNKAVLRIDGKEEIVDSCAIHNACFEQYYFMAFNEKKEIILQFRFNQSDINSGDSISSMFPLSGGGTSNLDPGKYKNSTIRAYKYVYKLNPTNNNYSDSIYLDAVFHIQFEDDKEIKGQMLIRDTLDRNGYTLCL